MRRSLLPGLAVGGVTLIACSIVLYLSDQARVQVRKVEPTGLDSVAAGERSSFRVEVYNRGSTPIRLCGTNAC